MSITSKKYMTDKDAARLQRIISAARHQIEAVGLENMTMRSLAIQSRVSPTTLYNRFGTKDNIVALVVIENYETFAGSQNLVGSRTAKPLDNLLALLQIMRNSLKTKRSLSKALVSMYFKHDNDRELPNHLLEIHSTRFLAILKEMQEKKHIHAWVNTDVLSKEMSDHYLSVLMKWSQNEISEKELFDRICFSALLAVAGVSTGTQLKEVLVLLRKITTRINKP